MGVPELSRGNILAQSSDLLLVDYGFRGLINVENLGFRVLGFRMQTEAC